MGTKNPQFSPKMAKIWRSTTLERQKFCILVHLGVLQKNIAGIFEFFYFLFFRDLLGCKGENLEIFPKNRISDPYKSLKNSKFKKKRQSFFVAPPDVQPCKISATHVVWVSDFRCLRWKLGIFDHMVISNKPSLYILGSLEPTVLS